VCARAAERTCVGCRARAAKTQLLRIVRADETIALDVKGSAAGRGAYVHRERSCVEEALRRGAVARALRTAAGHDELGRLRASIEKVLEQP
jgi:predicted RNA-binding protein YlxR (DUF448 family)